MAHLKIATFNCAGLGVATRRKAIFDYLRKIDAQIFCLQETHSTTLEEHKWALEWSKSRAIFHSNPKNDRSNGVAFLLNHPNLNFTNWHGDQHGRVITADFFHPHGKNPYHKHIRTTIWPPHERKDSLLRLVIRLPPLVTPDHPNRWFQLRVSSYAQLTQFPIKTNSLKIFIFMHFQIYQWS